MRKLHPTTLEKIANLILGHEVEHYRSGAQIDAFLVNSGLARDELCGTSRFYVAFLALEKANESVSSNDPSRANLLFNILNNLIDLREYLGDRDLQGEVICKLNEALEYEGYVVEIFDEFTGARIYERDSMEPVQEKTVEDLQLMGAGAELQINDETPPRRVFIVHGHDRDLLNELKVVLHQLGIDSVVLQDIPGRGKTIIEKFEELAKSTSYAIVLLSPDDVGKKSGADESKTRARQNVILELGYFYGRLGRDRVTAIHKNVDEVPSDIDGVLTVRWDESGKWKRKLANEMKAADLPVDMNKLSVN
jgi:predicted nucleotide-binding protein